MILHLRLYFIPFPWLGNLRSLKDNRAVKDIGHKPYTDSFIHQTSYGKEEEVFMDYIVSLVGKLAAPQFVGKQLFIMSQFLIEPIKQKQNWKAVID